MVKIRSSYEKTLMLRHSYANCKINNHKCSLPWPEMAMDGCANTHTHSNRQRR